MFNKKAQTNAGLTIGLVFGIASLVIAVIIAFVIVSTLTDADLLSANRVVGSAVNESGWINATGYTLANSSLLRFVPGSISISLAFNETGGAIVAGNYTVTDAGVITNATVVTFENVNFTYTYNLYNLEEMTTTTLNANFTEGVDNVSKKIPTVLLVAAIVLILGVLVLLVSTWQRMRLGGGSI